MKVSQKTRNNKRIKVIQNQLTVVAWDELTLYVKKGQS